MFWLPELWSKMLVTTPLKMAGLDITSGYGQYLPENQNYWERVERYTITSLKGRQEPFCRLNQHLDPIIIKAFGSQTPGSSLFLLHWAPCDYLKHSVPVLLVHGAALNANSWAVSPGLEYQGLAGYLVERGFQVVAITFSHPHGDNNIQAMQLAAAVELICKRTGSKQVDVVCHSKGGIACRCWLQGMAGLSFTGNVRRLCLLGVPNLGTDQAFRHPMLGYISYIMGVSYVMAYDRIWSLGTLVDITPQAVYAGGSFPGQAQMLYEWDQVIPLDPLEPEAEVVYHGGWGVLGHSMGIGKALADGGYLIKRLDQARFPQSIEVALLGGTNHCFGTIPSERGAVSDGVVFKVSALYQEPFARSQLQAVEELNVNHLEMLYDERVCRWVCEFLSD